MTKNRKSYFKRIRQMRMTYITLVFAVLLWFLGPAFLITTTSAAQLTNVSATASSSAPSVSTNYTIRYTTLNPVNSASTTNIRFDPAGGAFDLTSLTYADVNVSGFTKVLVCGGGSDEATLIITPEDITFTVCAGKTIPPGAKVITFLANKVVNPSSTGSYIVRVGGTMTDSADTRVAIVNRVTMTATMNTNLTFSISSVASGTPVNGLDTTSTSTTATAIGFGSLQVGTSSIAAQQLSVTTNAGNGYSVTVTENQDLTSNNGATINAFKDGNPVTGTPTAWTAPAGTIGIPNTYGHMGLTSDDDSLPGGDEFGNDLYAGLTSTSTRIVMFHAGPADGSTQGVGIAKVAYRAQITTLQEAASDYTNQLTYVCTPVF